jgi:hypothetical protein
MKRALLLTSLLIAGNSFSMHDPQTSVDKKYDALFLSGFQNTTEGLVGAAIGAALVKGIDNMHTFARFQTYPLSGAADAGFMLSKCGMICLSVYLAGKAGWGLLKLGAYYVHTKVMQDGNSLSWNSFLKPLAKIKQYLAIH